MTTTVWVDDWQQACCGDPFAVGGTVRWSVVDATGGGLGRYFPASSGVAITYAEQHHGPTHPGELVTIEGRVTAIHGVQLRYVEDEPGSRSFRPVPGSARLTALADVNGPERRTERFTGYVVDLHLESGSPGIP